jgi:2Fe-2S ferredoxin
MGLCHIYIKNLDQKLLVKDETSLLEVLLNNKIDIDHSCGGMGSCGTCRVITKNLPLANHPRNEIENERAQDLKFSDNERLSCQLPPIPGLEITWEQT